MKNQSSQNLVSEKEANILQKGKTTEVLIRSTLSLVYHGTPLRIINFFDI